MKNIIRGVLLIALCIIVSKGYECAEYAKDRNGCCIKEKVK